MPAFGGDLLGHLLAGRRRERPATVLVHPTTGRLEPLAAVYEAAAAPAIEQALAAGQRSVTAWLETCGAHSLAVPQRLAGQLANVNTPADFDALGIQLEGEGK